MDDVVETLDALGDAILVLDASGTVLHTSPEYRRWPGELPSKVRSALTRSVGGEPLRFVERIADRWAEVAIRSLPPDRAIVTVRDVDDRVRAQEEVKRLRLRVLTIQEDERRSISQNLHDELGQGMTALAMTVSSIADGVDDPHLAGSLADVRRQVEAVTKRMRQLFYRIRPPGLNDDSLAVALADYCATAAHSTGIKVIFDAAPDLPALGGAEATALYRLLQEALTNAAKHASARAAWVTISAEDDAVSLAIEDDGVGFDPDARPGGIGLAGLRERFAMLEGELVVDSKPGSGTRISGAVPVRLAGADRG